MSTGSKRLEELRAQGRGQQTGPVSSRTNRPEAIVANLGEPAKTEASANEAPVPEVEETTAPAETPVIVSAEYSPTQRSYELRCKGCNDRVTIVTDSASKVPGMCPRCRGPYVIESEGSGGQR